MLATIHSAALRGIDAELVHVEVNHGETGPPETVLVGLPDAAVKESRDRVGSALANSGFEKPRTRVTINLAPGHLRKEGPCYDLPIALGLLAATSVLSGERLQDYLIAGELSLSGATRPIRGALAIARLAKKLGKRGLLLPAGSAAEAALVEGLEVHVVESLDQAFRFLAGMIELPPAAPLPVASATSAGMPDFADVKGQAAVRRAIEVAVAGGHNILMIGPPGSGKSMIAKRVPSIMPPPALDEALEILSIQSVANPAGGEAEVQHFGLRPVRCPHHTISDVGLLGGGTIPGPGEVSLAHHGVLFLDELPEFKRSALEVLRQPLEDGRVTISRSAGKITLPCAFMLVSAMNPCPCGYLGDNEHTCRCTPAQIQRYRARVSGPLLDRIDLHVEAPAVSVRDLRSAAPGEPSAAMRARITAARDRQLQRFSSTRVSCNARMTQAQLRRFAVIDREMGDLLERAMTQLSLSARAYDRILKVARTIADLAGAEHIASPHLLEAIQYRSLDRSSVS
ncbi:YifB family Mg chelatase-like AAA ATPase [Actomonas aquatica]|uniref:YifB family Mg chelatase-like AAA ATPase n=1 Tax=Actomonas aquatica TaxID=2866162 RepID=A0ABZ1C9F1_9BACT|nr:YifB family Mg chelatase-like AAA ATPase [Opitutus sp. WL0086]WRQ88037.1 YifB family Mg chelatase-like AAA ATPase [Opitutus sp. WL0086]